MISEKQKNFRPRTETTFYIVGPRRLENEMIASCLKGKTGRECFLLENIDQIPVGEQKDRGEQRLVLYCCHGKDLKRVLAEIKDYTKKKEPGNRIVFFNVSKNMGFEEKFVSKGILGFFYEHDPLDIFLKGIGAVLDGKLWLSRDIMTRFILDGAGKDKSLKKDSDKLTERQIEILALTSVGSTNEEIADKLCISPHTVKTHLYRIFKKINVPNRVQAALWAAKNL
ncbi:MAG: response regulator transcription factor [Desulfobacterales bacterium]|nr:response regulator transcription factor [Desulfobacterales bacterium]